MSYDNSYSIKVVEHPKEKKLVMKCPNCGRHQDMDIKFCPEDGTKLEAASDYVTVSDIISKFRLSTEDSHLINNDGSSEESGSGGCIEEDLQKFSEQYPNGLFQLDAVWDSGFGESPSRYFFKGGKKQECNSTLTFEEFDESKLK